MYAEQIAELTSKVNKAIDDYENGHPQMSDEEFDKMWFDLVAMEGVFGADPDSPTQKIRYQVVNQLEKVKHEHPMLSLDKTKDIQEAFNYIGTDNYGLCMLKMDGLTCSLTYEQGKLVRAETRGNGEIGENILHNALVIPSIPNYIAYKEKIVIDGEIICDTKTFQEHFADEYKNPRNFASGSIRLLDSRECAERKLKFVAWEVIKGFEDDKYLSEKLYDIACLGFTIVPYISLNKSSTINLTTLQERMVDKATMYHYPIDGLVFKFDDVAYGNSLGQTGHHLKNAIAYKFYDETYETLLQDIEWTMGRTGVLTPVAIFKPVEIDGTTVTRANLHNINIMYETLGHHPYKDQTVYVAKMNQIIPQIVSADKNPWIMTSHDFYVPGVCPYCHSKTTIKNDSLYCENPECSGKIINQLDHFCGKKGLDIRGLSVATLEKLLDWGWINEIIDIFSLKNHKKEWIHKPGFGPASVEKILQAIESARTPTLDKFICALGIPLVGPSTAKQLAEYFGSWEAFRQHIDNNKSFYELNGFGIELNNALLYFDYAKADNLVNQFITIQKIENNKTEELQGLTFVITGTLHNYKNRAELQKVIESKNGRVVNSISKNTSYLICNNKDSTSAKHTSANKLGIPIITEEEFIDKFLT